MTVEAELCLCADRLAGTPIFVIEHASRFSYRWFLRRSLSGNEIEYQNRAAAIATRPIHKTVILNAQLTVKVPCSCIVISENKKILGEPGVIVLPLGDIAQVVVKVGFILQTCPAAHPGLNRPDPSRDRIVRPIGHYLGMTGEIFGGLLCHLPAGIFGVGRPPDRGRRRRIEDLLQNPILVRVPRRQPISRWRRTRRVLERAEHSGRCTISVVKGMRRVTWVRNRLVRKSPFTIVSAIRRHRIPLGQFRRG